MITQDELKSILHYDPETGIFRWLTGDNGQIIGGIAGSSSGGKRIRIGINGKQYKAHRLAFMYQLGRWPKNLVDHKNRNPLDNAWKNLREATYSQNLCNTQRKSSTGYKNVYPQSNGTYYVKICMHNKAVYERGFETVDAAFEYSKILRKQLHGEFSNHGEELS